MYKPPRDGPTLWEIGIPDRSAAEFYVPDPNPSYVNKLFVNHPDRLAFHAYTFLFKYLSRLWLLELSNVYGITGCYLRFCLFVSR